MTLASIERLGNPICCTVGITPPFSGQSGQKINSVLSITKSTQVRPEPLQLRLSRSLTAHRPRTETDIVESFANSPASVSFRRARAADASEVATVYIASRRGAAQWLPTVGTDGEIRPLVPAHMVPHRPPSLAPPTRP